MWALESEIKEVKHELFVYEVLQSRIGKNVKKMDEQGIEPWTFPKRVARC